MEAAVLAAVKWLITVAHFLRRRNGGFPRLAPTHRKTRRAARKTCVTSRLTSKVSRCSFSTASESRP